MKEVSFLDVMAPLTEHLDKNGVFLTVAGEPANTMTVGWATIGSSWHKPIVMVLVRPQRHTFSLMEQAEDFTVSIPTKNPLKAELAFAGTKSGRDFNKFEGHGLTAVPAQKVKAPIVAECGLHLECRIVHQQMLTGDEMSDDVNDHSYPQRDYHKMYFGEIVACYTTDE